ncbi:MAG TPA: hypothetical protein VLC09_03600, partial [Polyangiaceae bacterium]|nr:hypothetical protein [Polyangiaceae bacterium]
GRDGFWVHSVFLWEELVHVPLLIRAPGVPARAIETAVSLVDLAPTLAPYFDLEPTAALYHGEDLMEFALGHTPNRRLPLVLRGANRDRLERIGLIDPATGRKLVLSLEAAIPELYSVPGDAQEAHNLARAEGARLKEMLGRLGRSPVYPRSIDDFDLLLDHGRLGLPGVEPPRTLAAARAAGEAAGGAELEAGVVAPPGAGAVDVAAALPGSELVVPGGSVETAAGAGPGGDALTVDALPIEARSVETRSVETLSVEPTL